MDCLQDTTRCESCGSDEIETSCGFDTYANEQGWWWVGSFNCRNCGYNFNGMLLEESPVYIVSFAPLGNDGGIGGFDHFPPIAALTALFWYLRMAANSPTHRVRLLRERRPVDYSPEEITKYIDENLDYFELDSDAILDTHPET